MESERLKLTPPSLKYSEEMFEVINECKAEFSQFLPWVSDSLTKEQLELNIQDATNNFANFTGEFWFNIIEKQTGAFIGAIGFMSRDDIASCFEIGYWLQTSKTGLGYVSEAVRIIEEYAFIQKGAKRVEIRMAGSNLKSKAVAKRCGYQQEACFANDRRLPSGELDSTLVYAKTSQS
ncbi:GNAT family N-acetyltransferase [Vibrio lentus]|uniref:Ribosomal protein acetyltransferase n=1 Tax=Vibrio lentus TaxID=136468 RepID=A0A2N7JTT9_9VIBR|nr:GNAT family N-acetyltransferase [Vibrio lentus]PMM61907.1 ribosomal protein acetyltransferase [Vibrio lentus]